MEQNKRGWFIVLAQRKIEDRPLEKENNKRTEEWFMVFYYFWNKLEGQREETD